VRRAILPIVLVALLAAGCGARSSKPFTAQGTIGCLKAKNFAVTTNPAQVGFIAAFADNGGVRATPPSGNVVTIAFTKDDTTVNDTVEAFRSHASAILRPHFSDVVRTSRNAVMVWTTTPSSDDDKLVQGCLAS
jgi:hypothetical protein